MIQLKGHYAYHHHSENAVIKVYWLYSSNIPIVNMNKDMYQLSKFGKLYTVDSLHSELGVLLCGHHKIFTVSLKDFQIA